MKKSIILLLVAVLTLASCSKYKYESVKGDPTKTRIYTLANGLKVYMSVDEDAPRIQTMVAVKVGSKNDPMETTGLAHYFEHLMFKGTKSFGTSNYELEEPLLDSIETLFEKYRTLTDQKEREAVYAQIDAVSQEAAKFAIPNEYDKLMQAIGADGSNAWTSYDETNYIEEIPSNQIENWAKIQADRFQNAVIRGFHTELETVYEEYNMSLTRDMGRAVEKSFELLSGDYPYNHSVIGIQDHLKNPSITNIKNYYKTYYVPNNMAICMAGDFDPDSAIEIIDRYFGKIPASESLPEVTPFNQKPIESPISAEIYGNDSETLIMGWRSSAARSNDALIGRLASSVLNNGKCGLIDIDLIQSQKVLFAGVFDQTFSETGFFTAEARPRQGQTLDELRDLILAEVAKLRNGEFEEDILKSVIANFRRDLMIQFDDLFNRAVMMEYCFITGIEWRDFVTMVDRAKTITKQDIVDWANRYLTDSSYAIVYKRQGEDRDSKKINKPHITPISTNRDAESEFLAQIKSSEPVAIKPKFVDFKKDMERSNAINGAEILYKHNDTNGLFSLTYMYDFGVLSDPRTTIAAEYMNLLGTQSKTLEEINRELYAIACDISIITQFERTYITIEGLNDNLEQAIRICEDKIANAKGDDAILEEVKKDKFKKREDSKKEHGSIFNALEGYGQYGKDFIKASTMSNETVAALTSDELIASIQNLSNLSHRILYYGPSTIKEVEKVLKSSHRIPENPSVPEFKVKVPEVISKPEVLMVQYNAPQIKYLQTSCREGDIFNPDLNPAIEMFRTYFSGSMNAIVFQEMREARGLAYSAMAKIIDPDVKGLPYRFTASISTQNDKMQQAVEAFAEIIENMPQSEQAFAVAKAGLISNLETQRTTKEEVLWTYVDCQDKGLDTDPSREVYEKVQNMTLDDVVAFQKEHIAGRIYRYLIVGDRNNLDTAYLKTLGDLKYLSLEEIFGF